jgi:hypothetical protein
MRLGTGICKVALRFPGTRAGSWDPSAFAPLATRRHWGVAGELGAGRAGRFRNASHCVTVGKRYRGRGKRGDEADRGPHMAVREEEMWVVDGPAVRWAERPGGLAV